eukprot:1149480-Pelagomonas_calceolata.AAC.6
MHAHTHANKLADGAYHPHSRSAPFIPADICRVHRPWVRRHRRPTAWPMLRWQTPAHSTWGGEGVTGAHQLRASGVYGFLPVRRQCCLEVESERYPCKAVLLRGLNVASGGGQQAQLRCAQEILDKHVKRASGRSSGLPASIFRTPAVKAQDCQRALQGCQQALLRISGQQWTALQECQQAVRKMLGKTSE